jgi:CBS domain-containing protein
MTPRPVTAYRQTPLTEVARSMVDRHCGMIPIVDLAGRPVGVITDRDIVCRAVAHGRDPCALVAEDCMTTECVTMSADTELDRCAEILEDNQIRRALVVDDAGVLIGVVALADLARLSDLLGGEVVAAVSMPSDRPSAVH